MKLETGKFMAVGLKGSVRLDESDQTTPYEFKLVIDEIDATLAKWIANGLRVGFANQVRERANRDTNSIPIKDSISQVDGLTISWTELQAALGRTVTVALSREEDSAIRLMKTKKGRIPETVIQAQVDDLAMDRESLLIAIRDNGGIITDSQGNGIDTIFDELPEKIDNRRWEGQTELINPGYKNAKVRGM